MGLIDKENPKSIFPWKDYNTFESKSIAIPPNAEKVRINKKIMQNYNCGSKKRLQKPQNTTSCKKCYLTHNNGGRPYLVSIDRDRFTVHAIPSRTHYILDKDVSRHDGRNHWMYIDPIIPRTKYIKIWIGRSPKNKMTKFSGGFGRLFNGNSILIQISDTKYMFVGQEIFEFHTKYPIVSFLSPVGNNDVPYPFAIDQAGRPIS